MNNSYQPIQDADDLVASNDDAEDNVDAADDDDDDGSLVADIDAAEDEDALDGVATDGDHCVVPDMAALVVSLWGWGEGRSTCLESS